MQKTQNEGVPTIVKDLRNGAFKDFADFWLVVSVPKESFLLSYFITLESLCSPYGSALNYKI